MSDFISVKFDDREVRALLDKLHAKTRDTPRLMREISGIMADSVEQNFESEGRPRWPGLAASTIRQRQRRGNWPGRILQLRGRLASSIQASSSNDAAMVGTNVKYARIQQYGGRIRHAARERILHFGNSKKFSKPSKAKYAMKAKSGAYTTTIPPRPFLHLEPGDLRRISEAVKRYLANSP